MLIVLGEIALAGGLDRAPSNHNHSVNFYIAQELSVHFSLSAVYRLCLFLGWANRRNNGMGIML